MFFNQTIEITEFTSSSVDNVYSPLIHKTGKFSWWMKKDIEANADPYCFKNNFCFENNEIKLQQNI